MTSVKKRSLLCSAYRFFILGKIFGVSCFSIKKNRNNGKYTEVTWSDLMVLLGFIALQSLLAYQNVTFPQNLSEDDQIFNRGAQFLIAVASFACLATTVQTFVDREKLWTVIFGLWNIDKRMIRLGIVIDHSSYYNHVSIYLFVIYVSFCVHMSMFVTHLITTIKISSIFYIITCVLINGMITVISNQFHLLLAVLYTRFSLLNEFMVKTLNLNGKVSHQTNSTLTLATITEIARIHESLNAIATKTNYLFILHMFGAIASTFCMSIFPIYELVSELFRNISSEEKLQIPLFVISLIASAIFHNSLLIILVLLSYLTKKSSDQTAVIAHKAIASTTDSSMTLRLKLLSQQIMHQSPTFGCNMFAYDWPFIFGYVATMTSYLFILTQFHSTFDAPISTKS